MNFSFLKRKSIQLGLLFVVPLSVAIAVQQPDVNTSGAAMLPVGQYNPGNQASAPMAGIITVQSTSAVSTIVLGGTVVPYKEVTLSAQIPGRIDFIAGTEGDWFDENTLLVAVNDDDLLAKRRQAMAELSNADAAMRNAQVQYSRELWSPQSRNINRAPGMGMPSLFDQFFTKNMGSMAGYGNQDLERHADLFSRSSGVSQAQSRVMSARSGLEEIDARLRDAKSVAPFYGVIVQKHVEVGDTIQPGTPLLSFADTRYLQIQVEVPARLMPGIQKGMIVPATLDVGDTQVEARVAQIYPMADVNRHTVTVKLDLPIGAPGGPGMYANVIMPDANTDALNLPVIPKSAIIPGSLPGICIVNDRNQPELRLLRLGEEVGNNMVTVLSGVRSGMRIYAQRPTGLTCDSQSL